MNRSRIWKPQLFPIKLCRIACGIFEKLTREFYRIERKISKKQYFLHRKIKIKTIIHLTDRKF